MNKYIYQTIRAGFVLGVAFLVMANTALASVVLVPAGATDITGTSATLNGQVMNQDANSTVWFEWSDNSSMYAPVIAGKDAFYGGRTFDAAINGLIPGHTYYYRAVAVSKPIIGAADAPVYSPIISFKTVLPKSAAAATTGTNSTIYSTNQNGVDNNAQSNTSNTSSSNNSKTNTTTNTNRTFNSSTNNTSTTNTSNTTNSTKDGFSNVGRSNNTDGFSNGNSSGASVLGAGNGILPTTLVGWIALIIALLIILLIIRLIYEENERRKKIRLAKKAEMAETPASGNGVVMA